MTDQSKSVIRLVTAGSVDDGKSTLIGRLLYESNALLDDQLESVESKKRAANGALDLSLVVDGLKSEREQGITIDVAYKYFSSAKRKYILADSPGHVQYTRNMVTAASQSDLALILVDASQGLLEQSRRHAYILSMLGIKQVVLLVNKLDLVDYREDIFNRIATEFKDLPFWSGDTAIRAIPVSALAGDNIVHHSVKTPWYDGPSLLDHLDASEAQGESEEELFVSIQTIVRNDSGRRISLGRLLAPKLEVGQSVRVWPSQIEAKVNALWVSGKESSQARRNQAVAIELDQEIDLERGQLLVASEAKLQASDQLQARIVWFDEDASKSEQSYFCQLAHQQARAQIESIEHKVDLSQLTEVPALNLEANDLATVNLRLSRPLHLEAFQKSSTLGKFILVHPLTNRTVAAGIIDRVKASDLPRRDRSKIVWVDSLDQSLKSKVKNLNVSEELLSNNDEKVIGQALLTLMDQGWTFHFEDKPSLRKLATSLIEQGFTSFEDGAGI